MPGGADPGAGPGFGFVGWKAPVGAVSGADEGAPGAATCLVLGEGRLTR